MQIASSFKYFSAIVLLPLRLLFIYSRSVLVLYVTFCMSENSSVLRANVHFPQKPTLNKAYCILTSCLALSPGAVGPSWPVVRWLPDDAARGRPVARWRHQSSDRGRQTAPQSTDIGGAAGTVEGRTSDVCLYKGSSRIVNIFKSVHRVFFFVTPLPPSKKRTLKTLIFNDPVWKCHALLSTFFKAYTGHWPLPQRTLVHACENDDNSGRPIMLTFRQYPAMYTNYSLSNCTISN